MALMFFVLTAVSLCSFPLLGGVDWLRYTAMGACVVYGGTCAYVAIRAKPDEHYRRLFRAFTVTAVIGSGIIVYYIGVFSPAPIATTLGISFIGTSSDRRWAVGSCIAGCAIYSTSTLLIALGVIPDLGLIRGPESPAIQLFAIVMVPVVFLGTLRLASNARRTAQNAMMQVEDAARVVQQRDAQLAEANLDLDKALEGGGGRIGRHTGRHAGSWYLGPVIGRGAMGEVYSAIHENGQSTAAVKTLVATTDPEQLIRFQREAEIASRVRSPGLVSVFEIGALDDAVPYLVMELLHGHDLAWFLRKAKQLELPEVLAMCDQIAAGLRDAHVGGIIHRDIKPSNLFRHEPDGGTPAWKILDFGVSKLADSQGTLTKNLLVGTPGYMSPEQARGDTVDARSDLFSFGAVLYRALTGQPPFRGTDTPQILFDVVYRSPRRPTDLAPTLPADLDLFIAIAVAKDPQRRFASPIELATTLHAAANNQLSPPFRMRGQALIAELPWGGRVRGGRASNRDLG